MTDIFGVPLQAMLGQLLLGLVSSSSFYRDAEPRHWP